MFIQGVQKIINLLNINVILIVMQVIKNKYFISKNVKPKL